MVSTSGGSVNNANICCGTIGVCHSSGIGVPLSLVRLSATIMDCLSDVRYIACQEAVHETAVFGILCSGPRRFTINT